MDSSICRIVAIDRGGRTESDDSSFPGILPESAASHSKSGRPCWEDDSFTSGSNSLAALRTSMKYLKFSGFVPVSRKSIPNYRLEMDVMAAHRQHMNTTAGIYVPLFVN
ncbi:hypothetical protein [Rhizobium leguminosarum]|uniref:hypothetical protein n=1 Tax=Rhizobium leguminosarum TaxID=384 RepID=UPI0010305ACA|nr:hypothetical protein [Rhizobium leguminosarum]TAV92047.1 hypothetical protein ELI22_23645 [Rhizobium leguminosarum]TAV96655.1 hypothetical protein ELI21_23800 [Rhizobium leguminosarum]TAW37732.1 hypothetical protein ELI23_23850 [Rhizobium leguminosarum]